MILGLFLNQMEFPVLPIILICASIIILIGAIAFMIYRGIYEKGESDIDPKTYEKICGIAAWVLIIYAFIEIIAGFACMTVNDACRYQYHYDITKPTCPFCRSIKVGDAHSMASDCLTLGIYFDVFIVYPLISTTIRKVREKMDGKKN